MKRTLLDRLIAWFSPERALRRAEARKALASMTVPQPVVLPNPVDPGGGWIPLDDPGNPLNERNLRRPDGFWP